MSNETQTWNKILAVVLKMPGVKVDREEFLRKELRPYCNQSRLQMLGAVRPYTIVSDKVIDRVARSCINRHTALATAGSTLAGLPGGLAMAATIPGDLTQYFYHVFVLSQELAYLYGFPDFCDEDGELSDMASDLLTVFVGVMMGAPVAENGVSELAVALAENAVTRLPRVALTKAAIFPIASQVARTVGMKLTKEGFARGFGKLIPIAGGLFSGGLTLFTFRPGANRLRRQLRAQKHLFTDGPINDVELSAIKASFVKADEAEHSPEKVQQAMLQAIVNMAKINDEVPEGKFHIVEQCIAKANLPAEEKLEILEEVESEKSYDVDFDLLAANRDMARATLDVLTELVKQDEKATMAEKIYFNMVALKLGFSKDELDLSFLE